MMVINEMSFPNIEPEKLFEFMHNLETRMKYDIHRVQQPKLLAKGEDWQAIYYISAKPNVPMVAQREMLVKNYTVRNFQKEGQHLSVNCTVSHPDHPKKTGMFDYVRMSMHIEGSLVKPNPNGKGSIVQEYRHMDLEGSFPSFTVPTLASKFTSGYQKEWSRQLGLYLAGELDHLL